MAKFKRDTATKNLEKFLERVEKVNNSEDSLVKVQDIFLTGEYMNKAAEVDCVDLYITLVKTPACLKLLEDYAANPEKVYAMFKDKARVNMTNFSDFITMPERRCFKELQGSLRVLNLHDMQDSWAVDWSKKNGVALMKNGVLNTTVLNMLKQEV